MRYIPNSSYSAKGITESAYLVWSRHVGARLKDSNMHGSRKPVEKSGLYFASLKTFLLSVKFEIIRIGTSLNILVT